ncbi:MAG: disulfide bond formation protein B [Rhodospirillaceae bacterium]|jgi:disulfide bond formation protein DsbB|nr:disulfide bond formation protein B [Rhodospirillaceae bacterium]|tara:strand:- start:60 stop:560 length:501 start_codon:yes stop_codon:yes gene_type:complete
MKLDLTFLARNYLLSGLVAVSTGALAYALFTQYIGGLEPCILCKYQRIPYFSVILFAVLGLIFAESDQVGIARLIGYIFLVGAGLAFYHSGVEQHWWEAATSCGGTGSMPANFQDFQNLLSAKMPKRCDEIDWTLFGLSMTVYNMTASLGLAVISFIGASLIKRAG